MSKNKKIKTYPLSTMVVFFLVFIYILAMLLIILWGVPNPQRPFPFHMDEWHQLRGVSTLAKNYSNNVPGSGHGTMLFFILSGLYLVPFYLLHIINPANLRHNLTTGTVNEFTYRFVLLRGYVLIFGIGTLIAIYNITTRYIRVNPMLSVFLVVATPTFIAWSNYFKYEIPVLFWITCSLLFFLRYHAMPTRKRFIEVSIVCALAFSTKISAIPLLPILIASYLIFTPHIKKQIITLFLGLGSYIITVCLVGIPDLLLGKGDYSGFLNDSIVSGPQASTNMILKTAQKYFPTFQQIPIDFGYGIALLMLIATVYYIFFFIKAIRNKTVHKYTVEIFLLCGFLLFLFSLIPLKYFVTSNRIMVLLPFVVLLVMIAFINIFKKFHRFFAYSLLVIVIVIQLFQTYAWYAIKLAPDQRVTSSAWILKNIPRGSTIGLTNIPIYQMIPDFLLNDYYAKQNNDGNQYYHYAIIDDPTVPLPKYIVLTNADYENTYLKKSVKKNILKKMSKEKYKLIATFSPDLRLYNLIGDERDYNMAGLIPAWPITIYAKK